MSRKRRMFDIDIPEDPVVEPTASPEPQLRRGPMASAIAENAEALQARKSAAEAIREENDALAHEFVALKAAGNVVQPIPLDQVHTFLLARDRLPGEDPELDDLVISIGDIGLSNPIRVFPRADGQGYELVQGFRRLAAYRRLQSENGTQDWSMIPALITDPETDISGLYRRMVDENIVRKDLSFAEMAHAAINYVNDPATEANDLSEAVTALFQSAPYSKRSYIRAFAHLLEEVGDALRYAADIPRALGVALSRELKANPALGARMVEALRAADKHSSADELEILRQFVGVEEAPVYEPTTEPDPEPVRSTAGQGARTKTTFLMDSTAGQVKCTASHGRLEIQVDRDFSAIDRARLEQAVASLVDGLAQPYPRIR